MLDTAKHPLEDLIYQLNIISNEDLESEAAKSNKNQLYMHPMKNALFAEFCEIKRLTAVSARNSDLPGENNVKLMRLDNMLLAEGVIGQERKVGDSSNASHADYQVKLAQIRDSYEKQIAHYENTEMNFAQQVTFLLQNQQLTRPITEHEVQRFVDIIRQKFVEAQIKIKQCTCESVIEFKSKFFDARRKRRNFTKHTTEVLNNYFNTHIENPYPDDATKELLARQCNITVSQVTNWFGNKRIRYKKSIPKMQREAASRQSTEQANQYEMFNAAAMLNPYSAAMFATNPDLYSSMNFPTSDTN